MQYVEPFQKTIAHGVKIPELLSRKPSAIFINKSNV